MGEFREVAVSALLAVGAVVWLIVVPLMFLQGALTATAFGLAPGNPSAASPTFTAASWLGAGVPVVGVVVAATDRKSVV